MAFVEVLLCSMVPTQVFAATLLQLGGLKPRTDAGAFNLPFVVAMTLLDTVLLVGLMVVFTRQRGETLRGLWLGSQRVRREALLGLALILPVLAIVIAMLSALLAFAPWLHNVAVSPLEELPKGGALNVVLFLVVVIVAGGVREELARAFLLRRFEQHLGGATVGVVILSAAFGLGHVDQGWDAVITTAVLGAFWSIVYLRRRSSVAPIISHAGFNSLEVVRIVLGGA